MICQVDFRQLFFFTTQSHTDAAAISSCLRLNICVFADAKWASDLLKANVFQLQGLSREENQHKFCMIKSLICIQQPQPISTLMWKNYRKPFLDHVHHYVSKETAAYQATEQELDTHGPRCRELGVKQILSGCFSPQDIRSYFEIFIKSHKAGAFIC